MINQNTKFSNKTKQKKLCKSIALIALCLSNGVLLTNTLCLAMLSGEEATSARTSNSSSKRKFKEIDSDKFIFVYKDEGASKESVKNTKHSLKAVVDESYKIKGIKAEDVRNGIDVNTVALLVMPGGRATPYREKLYEGEGNPNNKGVGNQAIKRFIEEGGNYLGLGAGGYYAGSQVLFDQENLDERKRINVPGEKLLSFFPGKVTGPAFKPFVYNSHEGAKAIKLRFENGIGTDALLNDLSRGSIYYNGGGFFDSSAVSHGVQVIARYDERENNGLAIVECAVGKGKAILSSVHPEYTLETLDKTSPNDSFIQDLKPFLSDKHSYSVFKFLLGRLSINVNNNK